jgi:NinB protein
MADTVRLIGPTQRAHALKLLQEAPDGYVMKLGQETRTERQNRHLHALLGDIRAQLPDMQTFTIEQIKLQFMDAFGWEVTHLPKLEGAGFFPVGQKTSMLTVAQFCGLQDLILEYGARHGVIFRDER